MTTAPTAPPTPAPDNAFAMAVRGRLAASGQSYASVAAECGVTPGMISKIAGGVRRPGRDLARRIDRAVTAGGVLVELWDASTSPGLRTAARRPRHLPARPRLIGGIPAAVAEQLDERIAQGYPVVVTGPAGVGKTAATISWAHRHRWTDGALLIPADGRHPHAPPRTPEEIVRDVAVAVLPTRRRLTGSVEAQTAAVRETLSYRNVLLLVDDVDNADQVRPLAGIPGVTLVATSRGTLPGFSVTHHARAVPVEPLNTEDAVALVQRVLGRSAQSLDAIDNVAVACDHLPLALLAAGQLALTRRIGAAELSVRLAGVKAVTWLDAAVGRDPQASITARINRSLSTLDETDAALLQQVATNNTRLTEQDALGLLHEHLVRPDGTLPHLVRACAYQGG